MKNIILTTTILATITVIAMLSCSDGAGEPAKEAAISKDSLIKRGDYLVSSIGCDDCHSPKIFTETGFEIDMENRFSGYPAASKFGKPNTSVIKDGYMLFGNDLTTAVGPWGQSFAANISSDPTGIGNWSEAQFITALRKGIYKGIQGNRPLLPPMPWFVYKNLSDDDLKAIFAFLKSTKPVRNVVPGPRTLEELNQPATTKKSKKPARESVRTDASKKSKTS